MAIKGTLPPSPYSLTLPQLFLSISSSSSCPSLIPFSVLFTLALGIPFLISLLTLTVAVIFDLGGVVVASPFAAIYAYEKSENIPKVFILYLSCPNRIVLLYLIREEFLK
jgi:hypothetical protein